MIFHLIDLTNVPILDQLLLEEHLLREDSRNFCIFNQGSSPAIVMGISGKPELLIEFHKAQALQLPIIQRFSGGGTVVVDENTLFVSFICNKSEFSFPAYPEKIMKWSEKIYQDSFSLPSFALRENDFVLGSHKCGGNAQYIKKDRWLQHTSFLWDFCPNRMETLLFPQRTPSYRDRRSHEDFLCKLHPYFPAKKDFFRAIENLLVKEHTVIPLEDPFSLTNSSQGRRQTKVIQQSYH